MDSSESVARATYAALLEVGKYGRRFQSREIRRYLGYGERSPEAHQMHNVIGRLRKQGVLAVAGNGSRRRHLYLKVVEAYALRQKLQQATSHGRIHGTSPQSDRNARDTIARPVHLEDQVAHLEESVSLLDPRIAAIEELLVDVNRKVSGLVQLWS